MRRNILNKFDCLHVLSSRPNCALHLNIFWPQTFSRGIWMLCFSFWWMISLGSAAFAVQPKIYFVILILRLRLRFGPAVWRSLCSECGRFWIQSNFGNWLTEPTAEHPRIGRPGNFAWSISSCRANCGRRHSRNASKPTTNKTFAAYL